MDQGGEIIEGVPQPVAWGVDHRAGLAHPVAPGDVLFPGELLGQGVAVQDGPLRPAAFSGLRPPRPGRPPGPPGAAAPGGTVLPGYPPSPPPRPAPRAPGRCGAAGPAGRPRAADRQRPWRTGSAAVFSGFLGLLPSNPCDFLRKNSAPVGTGF